MNYPNLTGIDARQFFSLAICGAVFTLLPAWATAVAAEEEAAQGPSATRPASPNLPGEVSDPVIPVPSVPGAIPTKEGWKQGQERRNEKALVGDYFTPAPADSTPAEMLRQRMRELQRQQEQLAREYQEATKAMQQSLPRSVQLDMERQELQARLAQAKAQIAELSARQEHVLVAPLPENAVLRVFALKYVKPEDIGQALHNITGGGGPRIAVDERTNALLIAGSEKQITVAEQLVKTLDQPGNSQQNKAAETVQVRVVWLLDGLDDRELEPPKASMVSPQVVDALRELGFEHPQVACQQLTTLTLSQQDRSGQFHFQVPVLIEGSPWQFEGQGAITATPDDRYAMEFNMAVQQPGNPLPQNCQLGGSILTPLGHYTVMGTTTFVGSSNSGAPGAEQQQSQHLSAFVVYLDRAKEYSDSEAKPKENAAKSR